jgi:hypothetical protein
MIRLPSRLVLTIGFVHFFGPRGFEGFEQLHRSPLELVCGLKRTPGDSKPVKS